jgi:hypothetical protein
MNLVGPNTPPKPEPEPEPEWRANGEGPPYSRFGRAVKYNKRAISEQYESMQVVPPRSRKQRALDRASGAR